MVERHRYSPVVRPGEKPVLFGWSACCLQSASDTDSRN